MFGLKVTITLHWGFWVRTPFTSRYQSSLCIPPPTTLVGAIANPLISLGHLRGVGGEVYPLSLGSAGRTRRRARVLVSSPTYLLEQIFPAASFYYSDGTYGFSYEDINKYITLHFQRKKRRYEPEYRTGAIKCGKVTFPNGKGVACYLINEDKATQLIGQDWKPKILQSSYNITRMGSKESIVSIDEVHYIENLEPLSTPTTIETKFYVPLRDVDETSLAGQEYYIERFWKRGWYMQEELEYEDYVVPGTRVPTTSKVIKLKLKEGAEAYTIGPEETICL